MAGAKSKTRVYLKYETEIPDDVKTKGCLAVVSLGMRIGASDEEIKTVLLALDLIPKTSSEKV